MTATTRKMRSKGPADGFDHGSSRLPSCLAAAEITPWGVGNSSLVVVELEYEAGKVSAGACRKRPGWEPNVRLGNTGEMTPSVITFRVPGQNLWSGISRLRWKAYRRCWMRSRK